MNEVEKLYENTGVKYYKEICAIKNVIDTIGNQECYFEVSCTSCPLNKTSFTTEKLINLEMFLINKGDFDIKKGSVDITFESFTSCIAGLINNLWQDLTDIEKAQIKNILER